MSTSQEVREFTEREGSEVAMYDQMNPAEMIRERQLKLLEEAENRRLARQLRMARGTSKEGSLMRRALLLLSTMVVGLLLASGVALASSTVVIETFRNPSPIQIPISEPAANPYPSQISVSGLSGTVRDVNLKLKGFSHTFPDDADVLLEGPQGQTALVMGDVGGQIDVSGITLTLDDEAASLLPDSAQLTTGRFKPTDGGSLSEGNPVPANFPSPAPAGPYGTTLSVFDGTAPNGTWKLYVLDDSGGDIGQFELGWSLRIKARDAV